MQGSAKVALSSIGLVGPQGPPGNTGVGASFAVVTGQVDFGMSTGGEEDSAVVTVSAAGITSSSKIVCQVDATSATADHDPDDVIIEQLMAYPENRIEGVSFDVKVTAPNGTWGKYNVIAYIY